MRSNVEVGRHACNQVPAQTRQDRQLLPHHSLGRKHPLRTANPPRQSMGSHRIQTPPVHSPSPSTDNFVKNYFYAKLRRCMRKVNKVLSKFAARQFHKVETTTLYKIIETAPHNPLSLSSSPPMQESGISSDDTRMNIMRFVAYRRKSLLSKN